MSDRHTLYGILERKVESVVQGKMQLRKDYLKLRLVWSAKIRNKEVQKWLRTNLIENLSLRDCNFTSQIIVHTRLREKSQLAWRIRIVLKNRIYQESHARTCQEVDKLRRICCEETHRARQMQQERYPTTISQL